MLRKGWAERLLVSGVDREVKPHEFALEYKVSAAADGVLRARWASHAVDTRSNASETARWVAAQQDPIDPAGHQRLAHAPRGSSNWHGCCPRGVTVLRDAVPSQPSLRTLFLEYHKLLARRVSRTVEGVTMARRGRHSAQPGLLCGVLRRLDRARRPPAQHCWSPDRQRRFRDVVASWAILAPLLHAAPAGHPCCDGRRRFQMRPVLIVLQA